MFEYRARLDRVVDGDTVKLLVDHGMYIHSTQSIRLLDVWAPELSEPGGHETKNFVIGWFFDHMHPDILTRPPWPLTVVTEKDKRSFNRYVGTVVCIECGESLNEAINKYLEQPS